MPINYVIMDHMNQTELKTYLNELIGVPNSFKLVRQINIPQGLPRLYANQYQLKDIEILGRAFTLVTPNEKNIEIRKILIHLEALKKATKSPLIVLVNQLKSHQRQVLISHRINFLDLAGNVYLPDALLILQKTKEITEEHPNQLTQWAKIAIIKQFLTNDLEGKTASDLADYFAISKMHASRLVQELKNFGIVTIQNIGAAKKIHFIPKADLWKKALLFIQTPIIKKIYTDKRPNKGKLAGLTALGELTMLDGRGFTTIAIGKKEYLNLKNQLIPTPKEIAKYCIEVWDWDPSLLTEKTTVDPISLYLSQMDSDDDRIQIALKELLNETIGES